MRDCSYLTGVAVGVAVVLLEFLSFSFLLLFPLVLTSLLDALITQTPGASAKICISQHYHIGKFSPFVPPHLHHCTATTRSTPPQQFDIDHR